MYKKAFKDILHFERDQEILNSACVFIFVYLLLLLLCRVFNSYVHFNKYAQSIGIKKTKCPLSLFESNHLESRRKIIN